jgi:N-sulfoglucosamine sulfohydrolase
MILRNFRTSLAALFVLVSLLPDLGAADERPNILICVSDDQSYPHASAYGASELHTPAFDRVASAGVLFENAFSPAPGCSPMRAAFLTGRQIWQLEHAGTHASSFAAKYETFQDRLEGAGYFVGYTGKGWGPGNWKDGGRSRNPAGPSFSKRKLVAPQGVKDTDYAGNFEDFLAARPAGRPFSFWCGGHEPHRKYKLGIGREAGKDPAKVSVPPFLPDRPEVRNDVLDYYFEIEWFDRQVGRILQELERRGELDNTLVIFTSDNGMPFPYAKANVNEYGVHMPLAVAWPAHFAGARTVSDLVSLLDVTATIYEAAGVAAPTDFPIVGSGLLALLASGRQGRVERSRDAVYTGRERHSSSRYRSLGYPARGIRTREYLYVRNFRPERWPAGAPQKYGANSYPKPDEVRGGALGPKYAGYHDIDKCPTQTFLVAQREDPAVARFLAVAVDRRPAKQLFAIRTDPGCLRNLAAAPGHKKVRDELDARLTKYLRETGDPRVTEPDTGDVFETYPRYSNLRWFPEPEWARSHPDRVPRQDWLSARDPRQK